MKKVYSKPAVQIESFEMSQYIASCDFNMRESMDAETCYAVGSDPDYGVGKVFNNSNCNVTSEEYCYGNMMGATPVFKS